MFISPHTIQLPVEGFCCVRWTLTSPGPHTGFLGTRVTFTVICFFFLQHFSFGKQTWPGALCKEISALWLARAVSWKADPVPLTNHQSKYCVNNMQATAAELFFFLAVNRCRDGPSDRWSDLRPVCGVSQRKYASAQVQWNEEQMYTVKSEGEGGNRHP